MAELEQIVQELTQLQDVKGRELEKLISNYKKDSSSRKTASYLNSRLAQLEELRESFLTTDEVLQEYAESFSDHPYFKKGYFISMQGEYLRARDSMTELLHSLVSGKSSSKEGFTASIGRLDATSAVNQSSKQAGSSTEPSPAIGLLNQQRSIIRTINHLIDGIDMSQHLREASFYEMKSSALMRYWDELRLGHRALFSSEVDPKTFGYNEKEYFEIEDHVQETLVFLAARKEKVVNTSTEPMSIQTRSNLPQVVIPRFDGDYAKWKSFQELFLPMVHNQPLGDAQRMWYLKTHLSGEAERLIRHMTVSDENYATAWEILNNRFDNKRLIVSTLLDRLLSQASIVTESPAAIKKMHDLTKECLLGLKNAQLDISSWDPIIIHILIKKLDKTTHNLYEQSLKVPRELQSLENFLSFLELRFQALEALGVDRRTPTKNQSTRVSTLMSTSDVKTLGCEVCNGPHRIFSCKEFRQMSLAERNNKVQQLNLCKNCLRKGHRSAKCVFKACPKCQGKHNSLLHPEEVRTTRQPTNNGSQLSATALINQGSSSDAGLEQGEKRVRTAEGSISQVLLSTVCLDILDCKGRPVTFRAVLDSGSQINLITEAAAKKLHHKSKYVEINIRSLGGQLQQAYQQVKLPIRSKTTNFAITLDAYIVTQIATPQPDTGFQRETVPVPPSLKLADPNFNKPGSIDILIGAEWYYQLLAIGQIQTGTQSPTLQNTVFGWVVAGRLTDYTPNASKPKQFTCGISSSEELELNQSMERFWKLEEADTPTQLMTRQQLQCENHFQRNVKRTCEGRFEVRLPFANDPRQLGESRNSALKRFMQLERKFNNNPELKASYSEFMNEYLSLGHMSKVRTEQIPIPHYFLPHHAVLRPESSTTKLRVVFDASSKTSSNQSLNDILHTGPILQDELFTILLRFRLPRLVFTADIKQMYRQILVDERDRNYQLILWRSDPNKAIEQYQLNAVTYGTTSAPYLATKCLQQLAIKAVDKFPLGSAAIKKDFYMDDLMSGANNLREANQKREEVEKILRSAGFELHKWCANHQQLIQNVPIERRALQLNLMDHTAEQVKTLGMTWLPNSDEFSIRTFNNTNKKVTKRAALSEIAHMFDPLGLMSPVIISAKIFIQKLWKLKLDWDAALPMDLYTTWVTFRQQLQAVSHIKIPRHIFGAKVPIQTQLHAFSDASEKAFGVAVYFRAAHKDRTVTVQLLCAKSRVAPIKPTTIPRLELCAAKLAAGLVHRLQTELRLSPVECYFWSDSEIVLHWLHAEAASYQTFVANRIAAIQEVSAPQQWRHVRSKENPADLASRGISPEKLKDCYLWFNGPLFLYGRKDQWPKAHVKQDIDLEKKRSKNVLLAVPDTAHFLNQINHCNSFRKLRRIVTFVIRFAKIAQKLPVNASLTGSPIVTELDEALTAIVKEIQKQEFAEEIELLKATGQLSRQNRLCSLTPFLDTAGLLRVGGRLVDSELPYDSKHQLLLPYESKITKLIMTQIHEDHLHVAPQTLLSITRQRFWPIKGKTLARSIVQNCVRCARARPKMFAQLMGNLPANRIQPARPFVNTGVDFAGPLWTHFKIRGKHPQKTYLAVFCCFATKAIHMELVTELTTEAFIGALKRFMGRRGNCRNIYCDNATNFIGANNQLKELNEVLHSKKANQQISNFCSTKETEFHFIPPRAPHFGGLWEAAVKSAKHLLLKNIQAAHVTYEELETIILEVEAILNSRPLTPLSEDPNDLAALTPGHFLIGEALTSNVDVNAQVPRLNFKQRWKVVMDLKHKFWQRWSIEYLNQLQHRYKWKQRCDNVKAGMMVVLKEDNTPVLKWTLGRIIRPISGKDGLVRVADVKTSSGILRRPIHKLAPLPVETKEPIASDAELQCNRTQEESLPTGDKALSSDQKRPSLDPIPGPSGYKKPRPASTLLHFLMVVGIILPSWAGPVKIHPFETPPGIYVESMGPAQLIRNDWKLVVYYDLRAYWKELDTVKAGLEQLKYWCHRAKQDFSCLPILTQFKILLSEIENQNELLSYTSRRQVHRNKRGAVDVVGNLAHTLFGILDSTYAEEMSNIIHQLEGNDQKLLQLLKNQTSIIDSTTNIMRESQRATEARLENLQSTLNQGVEQINNATHELQVQRTMQVYTALAVRLMLVLNNYQRIQGALLDVMMDTQHGRVSPLLLAPEQLRNACATIQNNLPSSLRLPAWQGNLLELYRLFTIEGCISGKQMIFRLTLPLTSYEAFELLHLIAVPTTINGTTGAISLSAPHLIINHQRDQYYPLSIQELNTCMRLGGDQYMCRQSHPLYRRGAAIASCELSFLNPLASSKNCVLQPLKIPTRWTPLVNPNHWIYFVESRTIINIECEGVLSQLTLNGSGIVELPTNCAIKEETITIQSHYQYPSSLKTSYIPTRNFTELQLVPTLDQLKEVPRTNVTFSEALDDLQQQLHQLQEGEGLAHLLPRSDAHQFAIGYTGLIIGGSILTYLLWKHIRIRCRQSAAPIPAPRVLPPEPFTINIDS